jgi:hypothetical protein
MKKLALPLLIGLVALSGCAHQYVLKLNNGRDIVTATKPKLKDGIYYFKDARGQQQMVSSARVSEVEPASMVKEERQPVAPRQTQLKKRHWYFLWLA